MSASQLLKGGLDAAHDLHTMARVSGRAPDLRADFRAAVLGPAHLGCATRRAQTILALHGVLRARLAEAGLAESMDPECRCLPAVAAMEFAGMPIDGERWEEVRHAYDVLAGEAAYEVCSRLSLPGQRTLSGVAGINRNSPRQVRDAFRALGIPPREARGRTNSSRTRRCTRPPSLPPLQAPRQAQERLPRRVPPARPPRDGKDTSHLSSGRHGEWEIRVPGPEPAAGPARCMIRGCFVASHGHRLVIADYAQFELRVIADISGDATMTRAFQRGEDVHRLTASLILDVPLDAVTKDERLIAKVLNIGLIYGMGARSLRRYANYIYGVQLTLEDAIEFRRRFFDAYSGVRAFHRSVSTSPLTSIRTLSGRVRRWPTGREPKLTELLNTRVQGTAADIVKRALTLLHERLEGSGARTVCCVHDELLVEAPTAWAEETAETVMQCMQTAAHGFLRRVPLEVEVVVAENWAGKS